MLRLGDYSGSSCFRWVSVPILFGFFTGYVEFCVFWGGRGGCIFFFSPFSVSLAWIIFWVVVRKGKLFKGIKHWGATIWFFIAVKNSCYSWTQYKSWLSWSDLRYPDSSPRRLCFGWLWCLGYPACKPGLNFYLQKRDSVSGFVYFFNNSWFTHYCVMCYTTSLRCNFVPMKSCRPKHFFPWLL